MLFRSASALDISLDSFLASAWSWDVHCTVEVTACALCGAAKEGVAAATVPATAPAPMAAAVKVEAHFISDHCSFKVPEQLACGMRQSTLFLVGGQGTRGALPDG
ncbi:hypothetical protein ACFTZI_10185 [Streptomyces decoyicus]|uniref:hypothetical protein n=1 Tax=Streptomyces decoyicus TaxID=249567 RepID=UPI00362AAF65